MLNTTKRRRLPLKNLRLKKRRRRLPPNELKGKPSPRCKPPKPRPKLKPLRPISKRPKSKQSRLNLTPRRSTSAR